MPEALRSHIRYPPGTAGDPGADVPGLPHAGSAGLLQQGRPLVHPGKTGRRRPAGHGPLLHDHEAPRGREGGVHPPVPLHAQHEGQHVRMDGRPLRRPPLREGDRLQIPQAEAGLRTAADRGADRPGHDDFPAIDALAAARIERDPGEPAARSRSRSRSSTSNPSTWPPPTASSPSSNG